MARKIWRYTMTRHEQRLWENEDMQGWRAAFELCVEDDARDQGCLKYILYDTQEVPIAKGAVNKLPEVDAVAT